MKTVTVVGHAFDCLPGHVQITGRGTANSVKAATAAAVRAMFQDVHLKSKRIHSFKLSVIVEAQSKEAQS